MNVCMCVCARLCCIWILGQGQVEAFTVRITCLMLSLRERQLNFLWLSFLCESRWVVEIASKFHNGCTNTARAVGYFLVSIIGRAKIAHLVQLQ